MKIKKISHLVLSFALALFFIYAGTQKFIPKKHKKKADNTELIESVKNDKFESPTTFRLAVKMLKTSGFLKFIGILQILSGLLIMLPKTRLIGLIFLLPITINVFCFHFFMDNEAGENIETGIYLALNILLILPYYKKIKSLLNAKILA